MKLIYAKLNLALALIIHLLFKRWFQKRGLAQFLADYKEDHLFPLTEHAQCLCCGFCVNRESSKTNCPTEISCDQIKLKN